MKKIILLFIFLSMAACGNQTNQQHIILNYKDFGPPSLAGELLCSYYWQWDKHGDSRPRDYNILVVVYRNVDIKSIKLQFPVVEEKEQDYRYVEYDNAIAFLNSSIEDLQANKDEVPQKLIATLDTTRNKIKAGFKR
jgi:hypothetical protein